MYVVVVLHKQDEVLAVVGPFPSWAAADQWAYHAATVGPTRSYCVHDVTDPATTKELLK